MDLELFQKATSRMIATNDAAYGYRYNRNKVRRTRQYSEEEIQNIIESGSLEAQQELSRNYFYRDGFYKQIIIYYATLLKYVGLLIPSTPPGKKIESAPIAKKYYAALDYVEKMSLPVFLTNCAQRALIDGAYYGVIVQNDKAGFAIMDLPQGYACSRFKDIMGNDLVEFNLAYFNTISDETDRNSALSLYPKEVRRAYTRWSNGKRTSSWVTLEPGVGICFPFFDGRPLFLSVIPTTIQYDKAVDIEQERNKEEIRKIIVQKIPHLNDGSLLFEPDEAEEMHKGAVGMMKGNENASVLTTYADVDAIVAKTSADNNNSILDRMLQNIYAKAGVSSQIFASTGSSTLETSINFDISLMMYLANKFARFISNIVNKNFSNGNISFKYTILPIGQQNFYKYADTAFKLSNSGYSLLIPSLAFGLSQRDIIGVKDLENNLLKLTDKLIPPSLAYTQSANVSAEGGRPQKEEEEKAEKTHQNEDSLDNQTEGGTK